MSSRRDLLNWLSAKGIHATPEEIKYAREMGYVATPPKNGAGHYEYGLLHYHEYQRYFTETSRGKGKRRKVS